MAEEKHNLFSRFTRNHAEESVMEYMQPGRAWLRYEPLHQGRGLALQLHKTCLDFFEDAARQTPDAPALTVGLQTLSYAQVSLSVNAFAAWMLQDSHIKPGDRVALYLPNSLSYMIAVLATFKAQLVVTNLNIQLEQKDILQQLQDCGAKVLVTIPAYLPQVEEMLLETSIRHIVTTQADDYVSFWGRLSSVFSVKNWLEAWQSDNTVVQYIRLRDILRQRMDRHAAWPVLSAQDVAVIQYTSGTAETPKAVALTHQSLSANFQQVRHMLGHLIGAGRTGLCPVPIQHISGLSFNLGLLSVGAHVVLSTLSDILHRSRSTHPVHVDIVLGTPFIYDQLLSKMHDWRWFKQVKLFLCGGTFSSRALIKQWHEHTGQNLCELYGLTEAGPIVTINLPQRSRPGSVGVLLPNTQVCVVGADQKPLGFNQPGELWVRGPQVMRGYWQQPSLTQQALTYDDWLKTGDIVALSEDGFMSMLERKKDTFWVQNQLVFPHQIEQQINQHEDVVDCLLMKDDTQANALIRLLVVARQGLTADKLREFLKEQIKSNVLPDSIEFVDYLPKGPMGKVLRRVLPLPSSAREREEGLAAAPRLDERDGVRDDAGNKSA